MPAQKNDRQQMTGGQRCISFCGLAAGTAAAEGITKISWHLHA